MFNTSLKIVYGRMVRFWVDKWLENTHLRDIFLDLYNLATDGTCTVASCYSKGSWNLIFRRNFNDWEIRNVSSLL